MINKNNKITNKINNIINNKINNIIDSNKQNDDGNESKEGGRDRLLLLLVEDGRGLHPAQPPFLVCFLFLQFKSLKTLPQQRGCKVDALFSSFVFFLLLPYDHHLLALLLLLFSSLLGHPFSCRVASSNNSYTTNNTNKMMASAIPFRTNLSSVTQREQDFCILL